MSHIQDLNPAPENSYQVVVVGGGITGAGILREAVRAGLKTLLVEQHDFAWGTSSRSSKLVHGGMRYLKQGDFRLTRESVLERERLLEESTDLVVPLPFMVPTYKGQKPGALTFRAGISVYNMIAGASGRITYTADEARLMAPHLATEDLQGCLRYQDAGSDDARLVLRLIFEARAMGGTALNRTRAGKPRRLEDGWEVPLVLSDGRETLVRTPVVVNATGVWSNNLRVAGQARLRPLRGSHLVFSSWRLPAPQAVVLVHPYDHRPLYLLPWEGATLFGTTDLDHDDQDLAHEPHITAREVRYMMDLLTRRFPSLNLGLEDVVSCFAGVRPVISTGKADPSKESRDHAIWDEDGLLTITGGKLTTFRLMALELLEKARAYLPPFQLQPQEPAFDDGAAAWPPETPDDPAVRTRLRARYGPAAGAVAGCMRPDEDAFVPGTGTLWAELRWAARTEQVHTLDDLMLRRVRLGLLLPHGAREVLPHVAEICREELGWDGPEWDARQKAYLEQIDQCYSLPKSLSTP